MAKNILIVALAWFAGFLVLGSIFGSAGAVWWSLWGTILGVGDIVVLIVRNIRNNREKARELELGDAYFGEREYDRAIKAYSRAVQIDPNYADAYAGLGNAYTNTQESSS